MENLERKSVSMKVVGNGIWFRNLGVVSACWLLLIFLSTPQIFGQVKSVSQPRFGRIRGEAVDEATQRPLAGANIVLVGTQMGAAADVEGNFSISRVPIGSYSVRVFMMGYESRIVPNVIVNPKRTTHLKIELKASVLEADSVVVTAGYFQEAKDAVVSNRSMDFEEIRSDPGSAEDVQRVIQALPSVVSGSDQNNEIIVRGGMPGENLFVMDNIEIPNPNHFGYQGTGGGPVNMLNNYFIRRVDFYAGAFPVRYGDKASSVMDISLRDGDRERYTGHFYLGMSGAGAMAEGPLPAKKGSWILSARKSFLDLIISSAGLTAIPHYYNLQGKMTVDLSKNNRLLIDGIFGNDHISIENEGKGGYSRGAENVRSKSHQYAFGATLQTFLGEKALSNLTASQTLNYWNQYVYDSHKRPYYTNLSTEIERTLKSDITFYAASGLELNFGGSVKAVSFDHHEWYKPDTLYRYNVSVQPPQKIGVFRSYPEWQVEANKLSAKAAVYGQFQWVPSPRFSVIAGLRYDYFQYIQKSSVDPRVGFSYSLSKHSKLNLAFAQQSQSPAYIALTANPKNSDLNYKRTKQVVLGAEHFFREDLRGTVELYYKKYRNVPIASAWLTPDPYDASGGRLLSRGKGFAKGVEFFLQKKMSGNVHFSVSYAYSIARGFDPRFDSFYNWDYDYRHIFTAIMGARFNLFNRPWYQHLSQKLVYKIFAWMLPLGDQVETSIRFRYLGGRPYTRPRYYPELQHWFTDQNILLNSHRFPPYYRFDFRLDRRFMFNGWNMVTYFEMMNVFDRDNIWQYIYNDDGSIDRVLQFKVFPVGGMVIEF